MASHNFLVACYSEAAYGRIKLGTLFGIDAGHSHGGPMRPLALVEERAPNGFTKLEDVFSPHELEQIAEAYKQTAGFDAQMLNHRPSLSVR
jgi:hypothetical protein